MTEANPQNHACNACNVKFGMTLWRHTCQVDKGGCGKLFCKTCLSYAVVPASEESKGIKASVSTLCKSCFKRNSLLDFSTNFEVIGAEKGTTSPSILFLHGGGGCRNMFRIHAERLADKGYRCVLIDLPGHGARMDEPLSTDTAIACIEEALQTHCALSDKTKTKPLIIGGSLGGYLTMEYLGRNPDSVSGAIVCMAGQNVGEGRGWAAGLGLMMLGSLFPLLGEGELLKAMLKEAQKNGHISMDIMMSMSLRTGMFFHQADAQIAVLKASHPAATLPHFQGPVLFINGSLDHRDSEQIWLKASQNGKLIVYEGADHFFSHDNRTMQKFIDDCVSFIENVKELCESEKE